MGNLPISYPENWNWQLWINGVWLLSYLSREELCVTVTVNNALELNSPLFTEEMPCILGDFLVEGIPWTWNCDFVDFLLRNAICKYMVKVKITGEDFPHFLYGKGLVELLLWMMVQSSVCGYLIPQCPIQIQSKSSKPVEIEIIRFSFLGND